MNRHFPEEFQIANKHVKLTTIINYGEKTNLNHNEIPFHTYWIYKGNF